MQKVFFKQFLICLVSEFLSNASADSQEKYLKKKRKQKVNNS